MVVACSSCQEPALVSPVVRHQRSEQSNWLYQDQLEAAESNSLEKVENDRLYLKQDGNLSHGKSKSNDFRKQMPVDDYQTHVYGPNQPIFTKRAKCLFNFQFASGLRGSLSIRKKKS